MKIFPMRRMAVIGSTALLVGTLAACAGGASGGPTATASKEDIAKYQATLDGWYEGTYKEPAGPAIAAPKGKNVWLVSNGLGVEYSVRLSDAAKQAAGELGWDLNVFDAKFDPNQMLTGVQQAVVAGADGIVLGAIDCATVKNAAQQAADAGIPLIAVEADDCEDPLFTHTVDYAGKQGFHDWIKDFGRAQAAWVIAKTDGAAQVIMNTGTDTVATTLMADGIKEELGDCPSCQIVDDVTYVAADFGPSLQEKIQQFVIKHPEANAFIPSYDAIMTQSGGTQAIKATGRDANFVVGGGEGTKAGIEQIRSGGGMQMCAGQSAEWEAYSALDALARIFVGNDPNEVDTGNGLQICDKDHNLPPEGEAFTPPIDFVAAYQKLWSLS